MTYSGETPSERQHRDRNERTRPEARVEETPIERFKRVHGPKEPHGIERLNQVIADLTTFRDRLEERTKLEAETQAWRTKWHAEQLSDDANKALGEQTKNLTLVFAIIVFIGVACCLAKYVELI